MSQYNNQQGQSNVALEHVMDRTKVGIEGIFRFLPKHMKSWGVLGMPVRECNSLSDRPVPFLGVLKLKQWYRSINQGISLLGSLLWMWMRRLVAIEAGNKNCFLMQGFQEHGRGKDLVKLEEIGTAMISLEECCWEMQLQRQQQHQVVVPIRVRKDGWASDAMLYVNVELVDANTPSDIARTVSVREKPRANLPPKMRDHRKSSEEVTYQDVLDLKQLLDLAEKEGRAAMYSSKRNSDSSSVSSFSSSSSSSSSTISISSASSSGGASPEPGSTSKRRFLPWMRRSRDFDKKSTESLSQELKCLDDNPAGTWETREFTSRDAETKLKTPVFFASIDQRDDSAGGESACTALVAVLAASLHANHPTMPTRPELDALIRDGSSEWRKLCDDEAHMAQFPNRHFDLETVLAAGTRPIAVQHDKAFVGFFQPESFASLSGAMSFDDIWREISGGDGREPGRADVYIVSWNDHFFVLKVESDCYYVIDTLGERLFEGCDKAYMLRFDGTSEMRSLSTTADKEEVIVTGKECCREFIKRFLAAIPLREELEIEKKGAASGFDCGALHRRLQIEFHYTVMKGDQERSSANLGFRAVGCFLSDCIVH